jgi:GntR family transcriptional repressor for pyruvate dehydrogenase complex
VTKAASNKSAGSVLDRLTSELGPIESDGLMVHIVREIKGWVVRGLVRPGERLPGERELASLLCVSRASLRQALAALQAMGVLEVRHGSGSYLAEGATAALSHPTDLTIPLQGVSFVELFEARRAMEAEAAACAALYRSTSDIQKLRTELDQMVLHQMEPLVYYRHDQAFHRQVAAASANKIFFWSIERINRLLSRAWLDRAKVKGNQEGSLAEHREILEAIEKRDPRAARDAVLRHVTVTRFFHGRAHRGPAELRTSEIAFKPETGLSPRHFPE